MAIIKCKNCGGDMEISEDKTFGVCEYCGSSMTLPKIDSDQRAAAFNRGNHFRRIGEFDKALAVYERIVAEDNTDAEAHWCCALCRFGIEYVEDPATYEWMPTCHRASFDSFLEDVDYLAAVEYSDGITRRQYQKDATKIAEVQRGILATSQKEEPFDVFICYKESDENGQRTVDSTLAQDIYYQLTDKGRRVFFSRITLEDKGGAEYEPYIFAALNSAKVMVVVGTTAENLNAVWVKNEWSRFLSLMKKDHTKLLLPCYRDMDPYDLPEQLSILQSYDMSKIGFIQDLIRGIDKVLDAGKALGTKKETVVIQGESGGNVIALIKRGNMALEDGDWNKADEFFDRVLDINAECAEAYLGKVLVEANVSNLSKFKDKYLPVLEQIKSTQIKVDIPEHERREEKLVLENEISGYLEKEKLQRVFVFHFSYESRSDGYAQQMERSLQRLEENKNLGRAEKYADGKLKVELASFKNTIKSEMEETLRTAHEQDIQSENDVRKRYEQTFSRWEQQITQMHKEAETLRESDYQAATILFEKKNYGQALNLFQSVGLVKYKESENYISQIKEIIEKEEKEKAEEAARQEKLKAEETIQRETLKKKRYKKVGTIAGIVVIVAVTLILIVSQVIMPMNTYTQAELLLEAGDIENAAIQFGGLGGYKDAEQRSLSLWDDIAERDVLSGGINYTVGLKSDGTVVAVGNNDKGQCDVSDWENIVAVCAAGKRTVGLKSDGTVVAVGYNLDGQCDVSDWKDIVAISAGSSHTVGLKSDGTVVAVGNNEYGQCDVSNWVDVVAVSARGSHTVGLKSDGTVVAVGYNKDGQCDVSDWENIVAISTGGSHTVGLKSDGTVVTVGGNDDGQCDVSEWENIVAVSAGGAYTVGLKSDGTVVAVGYNKYGQCDVSNWENIVVISGGTTHTVGLKSDGMVVTVGENDDGQCDVSEWTDIKMQ